MFDKFINRIEIEGIIETTSAIHIGAKDSGFVPSAVKNPIIRDSKGNAFIPGSSLKGVMRSFLESITEKSCNINKMCLDGKKDEIKAIKDKWPNDDNGELINLIEENTCIVCKLFGTNESAAKLLIRDCLVGSEIFSVPIEVRTGNAIDRDLRKSLDKALYDFEVVSAGTEFDFKMICENINSEEWNSISILINAMRNEMITVGGKISSGLGNFALKNIKVREITINSLLTPNQNEMSDFDSFHLEQKRREKLHV